MLRGQITDFRDSAAAFLLGSMLSHHLKRDEQAE
jgi:hypothetical protein